MAAGWIALGTVEAVSRVGNSTLAGREIGALLVPTAALNFDLWVMLAVAVACLPVFLTGREIARWEGGIFLGYYVAYVATSSWRPRTMPSCPLSARPCWVS